MHITTNTSGRRQVQKTTQTAIPLAAINRNAVFRACRHRRSDRLPNRPQLSDQTGRSPSYLTNIFNLSITTGQTPEIWHKAIIIPIIKPSRGNVIGKNWRPISLLCPAAKRLVELLLSKMLTHTTLLNMAFGRNTRSPLHCRRSSPTLLPVSQEKNRFTEQFSSRSI